MRFLGSFAPLCSVGCMCIAVHYGAIYELSANTNLFFNHSHQKSEIHPLLIACPPRQARRYLHPANCPTAIAAFASASSLRAARAASLCSFGGFFSLPESSRAKRSGGGIQMLLCRAPSPPRVQSFSPLPPLHPSCAPRGVLSPGDQRRGKKNKQQRVKVQSFHAKVRSLRAQSHQDDGYCPAADDPGGDLPGSAAPLLPDAEALASWLRSCRSLTGVRRAHAVALRSLGNLGVFVSNNLITAYARFDEVLDARKVFDEMPERSVVSWTAMMNEYQKLGHHSEVRRLFLDMVATGVQGNSLTYVCLLKSRGERRDARLGRQVHCCILKGGWSNVIVDSAVAHFYAQCGDVTSASSAFDKMTSRDVVSWTTMITVYVQHGHGDKALQVFSAMVSEGFRPNEFTVCSVLKACAEEKALRFGKQLHGAVVKKLYKEDIHVGSALVTMYARCGDVMLRRNTITWTSMISGYAQSGYDEEAIILFRKMKMRGVFVNNLTIVGLLSVCGSMQSIYLGKELHAHIIKNSLEDNLQIGSTLVWFYSKCGQHNYAARILDAMPDRDAVAWTAMISGYNSLGHNVEAVWHQHMGMYIVLGLCF
jgi:pentatricopeptide repeat protein